jgi:hypothetical protein
VVKEDAAVLEADAANAATATEPEVAKKGKADAADAEKK